MQVLRSIAAVVAGFGFMASTVMVGTIVATVLFVPGGLAIAQGGVAPASVPPLFLAANLAVSFLGAVFGGWLAARIGASAPFGHAVVLAVLTGALSVVSAIAARSNSEPAWYGAAIGIVGVGGVLLGGRLRASAASARPAVVA